MRILILMISSIFCQSILADGAAISLGHHEAVLNQNNHSWVYSLEGKHTASEYPFLSFEISSINNPKPVALAFLVHYITPTEDAVYLGTFSTYPANNPGSFIVPTHSRLTHRGRIRLTLKLDQPSDVVQVKLKGAKLIRQWPKD